MSDTRPRLPCRVHQGPPTTHGRSIASRRDSTTGTGQQRSGEPNRRAGQTRTIGGWICAAVLATCAILPGPTEAASKPSVTKACGRVPAYISVAIHVRQRGTSCRRARQVAYRAQFVCMGRETCNLLHYGCFIDNRYTSDFLSREDFDCSSGPRVRFSIVVPFDR